MASGSTGKSTDQEISIIYSKYVPKEKTFA